MSRLAPPVRVLLVEDDIDVATGLAAYLEPRGIVLDFAHTVQGSIALAADQHYDVLVLDIQLPDGDGVSLCRVLKNNGLTAAVIFLTTRTSLEDKLRGFDAGAVDYVVKPFAPAELLARIRAMAAHVANPGALTLRAGDYVLDHRAGTLARDRTLLHLQATAIIIMRRLMERHPGCVGTDELVAAIWGDRPPPSSPLRIHIHELRQALRARFGAPLITTVRGVGYRFEVADHAHT